MNASSKRSVTALLRPCTRTVYSWLASSTEMTSLAACGKSVGRGENVGKGRGGRNQNSWSGSCFSGGPCAVNAMAAMRSAQEP